MPEKLNSIDEIEELSLLLDELNEGLLPQSNNKNTAELLAVADLLKKSTGPVCPPSQILNHIVDQSLTEIQAGKRKKSTKAWWYSGALSTAAAVMLVVGLNLLPGSPTQPTAVLPQVIIEPQIPPAAEQSTNTPPSSTQQVPIQIPKTPEVSPNARINQPQSVPQNPIPPVPQIPVPKSIQNPDISKAAPIIGEQIPAAYQSKSAYSLAEFDKSEMFNASPAFLPLSLPGQVANLIMTDSEKGIIRQIYHQGTAQEIIVTQRLLAKSGTSVQKQAQTKVTAGTLKEQPNLINTVIVTKFGQEIMIEGRQSKQMLEKIAETLTNPTPG